MAPDKLFDRFSSSEFDFDDEDEATNNALDDVVQAYADDEDIDEELREAEKLISKAAYYKVIVKEGVINEDGTPQAAEINAEARLWARQRIAALLKLKTGPDPGPAKEVPSLFTDKEVEILRQLARKLLAQAGEPPTEPTVKKVQTEPGPTVKKVQTEPTLKRVTPKKKVQKPRPAPQQQSQAQRQPEQPQRQQQAPKPKRVKKDENGDIDYDAIPTGEPFRDVDGHTYKFVPHPDEDNRRIKMKITRQVRNPQALPMPPNHQLSMISEIQARESLDTGSANDDPGAGATIGGIPINVAAAAKSLVS